MAKRMILCVLVVVFTACYSTLLAKAQTQSQAITPTQSQIEKESEKKNIQAYIELLRSNVRQDKSEIMGSVMRLSVDDAAKFWPIYSEYDAELTKLNKLRSDNIQEYARNYLEMTDSKADELIKRGADYQKQRLVLLDRCYERVKEAIGAIPTGFTSTVTLKIVPVKALSPRIAGLRYLED
jgi:hypothetical protein